MILSYDAVDANGAQRSDTVEASSAKDALEILRRRGLFVTQISESQPRKAVSSHQHHGPQTAALPLGVLALFTRQMAMLLRAGSGLVPAIAAISRQMSNERHKLMLHNLIVDLEEGSPLNEALRKHPSAFDPVYCAIVAAGEASATIANVFERLTAIVGRRRLLRKKMLGALAYPALLITMCTAILLVLLFFVLPRFADMFVQLGVKTPASTRALLAVGETVSGHWPMLLLTGAALAFATLLGARTPQGRQWLSDIQIVIPVVGRLRSQLIQAQVLRTMGMLIESRVGVLETLELAGRSTTNRRFRQLFDSMERTVTSGGLISTALEDSGLIAPAICQAVRTGEESGNLGEALSYCADVLDETNEELVNVFARLIEPLILLVMGAVVGGVAISLFMPLFDLTAAIR
jgi:type II secretory pathway component PulF